MKVGERATASAEQPPTSERGDTMEGSGQSWRPRHLISGGSTTNRPRDELCATAEAWMRTLAPDLTDHMLAPFTPKKWGTIVEVRINDEALQAVAFKVQKILQQSGRASPPTCAALETSPQMGTQKRRLPHDGCRRVGCDCRGEAETLRHRMWECPRGLAERAAVLAPLGPRSVAPLAWRPPVCSPRARRWRLRRAP